MSTKIIVSYDGTANEDDAIALGRVFARAGAEVALAYVRHSQEPDLEREKLAQGEAEELLGRGAKLFGDESIARHVVTDRSTPRGLSALAASEGANIVALCDIDSKYAAKKFAQYPNAKQFTDYKVMLAVTLLIGVIYSIVNILTDLVHGLLDPRLWEQL